MKNLNNTLPAEKLTVVENAIQNAFNTTTVEDIILLAGGLSASVVFKIVVNGQQYVLKLDSPGIAPKKYTCMEIAANEGIAPPVYYLNKEDGVSITGFINNMPIQAVFTTPDMLLPQLAKTIRRIHALPPFPVENSLVNTVDGLIAQFKASCMLEGAFFDKLFAYYGEIRKYYPWEDADKVSGHNDLNPNNMVFDGEKIWVIDWDAAFINDRYVDLAIMANFYVTTDDQESIFLNAYFGDSINDYNRARFFVMRQVCRIVYAMLMFKLADNTKPTDTRHNPDMQNISLNRIKEMLRAGKLSLASYDGQLLFGKGMLTEAMNDLQSSRFAFSMDQLKNE
ncbi:MAG: phosphotransferase [Mucilaginibacter sp.]|uniref:phosphotransferase n=1 Tax=Mucilaginibacter sp. TaxID=1882438 RepID=UPI0031ADD244